MSKDLTFNNFDQFYTEVTALLTLTKNLSAFRVNSDTTATLKEACDLDSTGHSAHALITGARGVRAMVGALRGFLNASPAYFNSRLDRVKRSNAPVTITQPLEAHIEDLMAILRTEPLYPQDAEQLAPRIDVYTVAANAFDVAPRQVSEYLANLREEQAKQRKIQRTELLKLLEEVA